jgi:hypothetical protein
VRWFSSILDAEVMLNDFYRDDELHPDVIVGSSRGGAVAMNMDSRDTPLVLLAPAWKRWGKARSVNKNCIVIHSLGDEFVPFEDSVELCGHSGARLIAAGMDHRLNCKQGRESLKQTLCLIVGDVPKGPP